MAPKLLSPFTLAKFMSTVDQKLKLLSYYRDKKG